MWEFCWGCHQLVRLNSIHPLAGVLEIQITKTIKIQIRKWSKLDVEHFVLYCFKIWKKWKNILWLPRIGESSVDSIRALPVHAAGNFKLQDVYGKPKLHKGGKFPLEIQIRKSQKCNFEHFACSLKGLPLVCSLQMIWSLRKADGNPAFVFPKHQWYKVE